MIGRLVKNKNVAVLLHHNGKAEFSTFAAAYHSRFLENILPDKAHLSQKSTHLQFCH